MCHFLSIYKDFYQITHASIMGIAIALNSELESSVRDLTLL